VASECKLMPVKLDSNFFFSCRSHMKLRKINYSFLVGKITIYIQTDNIIFCRHHGDIIGNRLVLLLDSLMVEG
jgi:hypothetical protein